MNFCRSFTKPTPRNEFHRSSTFQVITNKDLTFSQRDMSITDKIRTLSKERSLLLGSERDTKIGIQPDFIRTGIYSLKERIQLRKIKKSVMKTLINRESSQKMIRVIENKKDSDKVHNM